MKNLFSKKNKTSNKNKNDLTLVQKLSLFFFNRPRKTAIIWVIIAVFGIASYTTFLKREGFPSIETPFALANGTYLVNNPEKVDKEVNAPIDNFLLKQDGVKSVSSTAQSNFYTIAVSFEENVNSETKSQELQRKINAAKILPDKATLNIQPYKFGFTERGDDVVVSVFAKNNNLSTKQLLASAEKLASGIKSKNIAEVDDVSVISPYESALNPLTGKRELAQSKFDRYGERSGETNSFYDSVAVGISSKKGSDNIKLDDSISKAIAESNATNGDTEAKISASYAPEIKSQINELQRVLLEGLIAVLVVGSIIIAIRASLLTVISMVTVLAAVNGLLYLIGYSLNTITLFSLILGLSLIIDDTIIMVEALDAQRKKQKTAGDAVSVATRKVSRAMIAATLTAMLSFTPLIFVSGILGEFIRAIPVTIISALFISLITALIFIPLFARFILLTKKQFDSNKKGNFSSGIEHQVAEIVARPMLKARHSKLKLAGVSSGAILFSLIFIVAAGFLFQKVTFNIFPAAKDANQISVTLNFPQNTDLEKAQTAVDDADVIVGKTIGENFDKASYYSQANQRTATLTVYLDDYSKREIKSPELVDQLDTAFKGFSEASVTVAQVDAGPPASDFTVRIDSSKNRQQALKLANDISAYLKTVKLQRPDGSIAEVKNTTSSNADVYIREDGKQYIDASASFVDNDTTTLVTLAQKSVEDKFNAQKLAEYGLNKNALNFNFGQEDENQDSFKTLALAFPIVLLAIYILLAIEFRSFLQPLLIFMAIPFSLFGITLGLFITNNAFSFFAMLGFFALIGLSIKNTILLTDFANQSRREGKNPVDAVHEALAERFRPLIATSITAVVSLIPLAITSPFWEGLTVVLIFGLISSTFLVITVFPYYYLAGEFARSLGRQGYRKLRKKS